MTRAQEILRISEKRTAELWGDIDLSTIQGHKDAGKMLAFGMETQDPRVMAKIKEMIPNTRAKVLKLIAAGSFWTAAILAMPYIGVPLFLVRLYQRNKAWRNMRKEAHMDLRSQYAGVRPRYL